MSMGRTSRIEKGVSYQSDGSPYVTCPWDVRFMHVHTRYACLQLVASGLVGCEIVWMNVASAFDVISALPRVILDQRVHSGISTLDYRRIASNADAETYVTRLRKSSRRWSCSAPFMVRWSFPARERLKGRTLEPVNERHMHTISVVTTRRGESKPRYKRSGANAIFGW